MCRSGDDFWVQAMFSSVQYSLSNDGINMIETLVLRVRDPKDLMQVSLKDSASSVTSSAAMLGANTPVMRLRLERFGKAFDRLGSLPGYSARAGSKSKCVRALVSQRFGSAYEL